MSQHHTIERVTEDFTDLPDGTFGQVRRLHVLTRKGQRFTTEIPVAAFNAAVAQADAFLKADEIDAIVGEVPE